MGLTKGERREQKRDKRREMQKHGRSLAAIVGAVAKRAKEIEEKHGSDHQVSRSDLTIKTVYKHHKKG